MKLLISALLGILVHTQTPDQTEQRIVAVFPIKSDTRFQKVNLKSLRNGLESDLVASGRFSVVAQSDIKAALTKAKQKSFDACYEEKCQIEIGKEVAAQELVTAHISRQGESCEVILKLYALREAATRNAASATDDCTASGIRRSLRAVAYRIAGIAPKKNNLSIRFKTVDLPMVEMPAFSREMNSAGLELDAVDVEALELYDKALKLEKDDARAADEKIAAWKAVDKKSSVLRAIARQRIQTWKRYERERIKAEAARKRFEQKRAKDFQKLTRLLRLNVVSEQDKQDWAVAFVEAYGGPSKNPYFKNPELQTYIARAAWPSAKKALDKAAPRTKLAMVTEFLARFPRHPAALDAQKSYRHQQEKRESEARERVQRLQRAAAEADRKMLQRKRDSAILEVKYALYRLGYVHQPVGEPDLHRSVEYSKFRTTKDGCVVEFTTKVNHSRKIQRTNGLLPIYTKRHRYHLEKVDPSNIDAQMDRLVRVGKNKFFGQRPGNHDESCSSFDASGYASSPSLTARGVYPNSYCWTIPPFGVPSGPGHEEKVHKLVKALRDLAALCR